MCARAYVRAYVYACVRACVHACVRAGLVGQRQGDVEDNDGHRQDGGHDCPHVRNEVGDEGGEGENPCQVNAQNWRRG